MTTAIHHGSPGSYKSFSVVQRVIIPALMEGRTVVTNIRGVNDLDRIMSAMNITIPGGTQLLYVPADSKKGFEKCARFFHWAPYGALIALDEAQRVYPTRQKKLDVYDYTEDQTHLEEEDRRPENVENAFDQHRHYNWDIYLCTTHIKKIHPEIRQVAQYGFRHREMKGILPRWVPVMGKIDWREYKHVPDNEGTSTSHVTSTEDYKVDKRVFDCYQSTKTGETKDGSEQKSILQDGRLRFLLLIIGLSSIGTIYNGIRVLSDDPPPDQESHQTIVQTHNTSNNVSDHNGDSRHRDQSWVEDDVSVKTEPVQTTYDPFVGYRFYIVGQYNDTYYYRLVGHSQVINIESDQLRIMGYNLEVLSPCLVKMTVGGNVNYAVCDQSNQGNYELPQPSAPFKLAIKE